MGKEHEDLAPRRSISNIRHGIVDDEIKFSVSIQICKGRCTDPFGVYASEGIVCATDLLVERRGPKQVFVEPRLCCFYIIYSARIFYRMSY